MKKKTLLLVIVLMSLSLIGLIAFQAYWIHRAVQMEEEVFDRNVNDALHQVARRLEHQEAMQFLNQEAPQIRAAALTTPTPIPHQKAGSATISSINNRIAVNAPTPQQRQTHTFFFKKAEDKLTKFPRSSIQLRYGKPGSSEKVEKIIVFGQREVDSAIIWKLLAAQKNFADTLKIKTQTDFFPGFKIGNDTVFKVLSDSAAHKRRMEIVRQIPVQKAKRIKEQAVNSYADTLLTISREKNFVLRTDSVASKDGLYAYAYSQDSRLPGSIHQIFMTSPPAAPTAMRALETFSRLKENATRNQKETISKKIALDAQLAQEQKAVAKAQQLSQVMQKIAVEYVRKERPLAERLQELKMPALLANELKHRDIQLPYQTKLHTMGSTPSDNLVSASASGPDVVFPTKENEYHVRLFPNDLVSASNYLLINFPNRRLYVWQSLWLPSVISVLFTLIIILTFFFTLNTILRQKKISEIKNDFINNMTHEFKTPIATISLALDALVNPKVRKDETRLAHYARIIRDENRRMHQQVEKVLQTAQMERNRLQLAFEEVEVHTLIQKTVEPFQLHIEQRQGALVLKLEAFPSTVLADPGHLSNMIANLLDNANKYSLESPRIVIQTAIIAKGLHISVEDQGVGMSKEEQKRVFEKFYRVPTGNVHNVKGFGLGLSYVKTMVEAHSGTIHVRSELGKGSRFTLWLPLQAPTDHS